MNNELFSLLGLTAREMAIYRALLSLGASSIRSIADKSGINRGSTYESLKEMQQKGIVTYQPKGKRRLFAPEDPQILLQLAEEKRQGIERAMEELKQNTIPGLQQLKPDFNASNVSFYEGDDGIEHVLKDLLTTVANSDSDSYSIFSSKPIRKHLYRPFPNFTNQRIQRGINVRAIAIGDGGEDALLSERKWIKTEGKVDAAYIAIYPPKCAIISLASENYPTAVVIDSPEVAAAQKIVFDTLWNLL